jgi:hypothetical protein
LRQSQLAAAVGHIHHCDLDTGPSRRIEGSRRARGQSAVADDHDQLA